MFFSSLRAVLAVVLLIGCQESSKVNAFRGSSSISYSSYSSHLKVHVLDNALTRGTIRTMRGALKMVTDIAILPESPPSDTVDTPPAVIQKQFSSSRVSSINLLKNCLGAGVFSLNARVSAISAGPTTIFPAALLVMTMAMWATYNFYMVGETCRLTDSVSYAGCWAKTVSAESQWLVQAVVVISPVVSCLASCIVLTDIFGLVLLKAGLPASVYENRNLVIGLLSSCVLYPLCILKDLSALKSVSVLGVFGHLVAMGALSARILDRTYFEGGKFFSKVVPKVQEGVASVSAAAVSAVSAGISEAAGVAAVAAVSTKGSALSSLVARSSKWFILASLLSYCFVTHYNAPRYYSELDPSDSDRAGFLKMASTSYFSAGLIYIGTIALGINLFGPKSASFALNSFSPKDPLGVIARFAFGTSVLASFPLIFLSMRNWFVNQAVQKIPQIGGIKRVSTLLLMLIAFLASKLNDIGVVGSVAGGILGSSMMFVFPPIMYIRALQKKAVADGEPAPRFVILLNSVLMVCGGLLGLIGTTASLLALKK